jgi:hypothetical protein
MAAKRGLTFDKIGYWSEVKLAIVKDYASAYSQILTAQARPKFHHIYVDAFAGTGMHLSKTSGKMVPGSPLNALAIGRLPPPPLRRLPPGALPSRSVRADAPLGGRGASWEDGIDRALPELPDHGYE